MSKSSELPPGNLEVTSPEGLETFAVDELRKSTGLSPEAMSIAKGVIRFAWNGDLRRLTGLKCANAVFLSQTFDVSRPKALLGHQHFEALASIIYAVMKQSPRSSFRSLALSAAGSDTAVMSRIRAELAARTGLVATDSTEGNLLLRLRSAIRPAPGWEALVRLTPRPLSTRDWRKANMPGALNGPVAHIMDLMTEPTETDRFLNIACGSGSLLVERLDIGAVRIGIGVDIAAMAIEASAVNLAGRESARVIRADAGRLPLPASAFDVVVGDLPFGKLVGGHSDNEALYPRLLDEMVRVTSAGARIVLITHDIRLMELLLTQRSRRLKLVDVVRTRLGAMSPRIYRLRRLG